MNCQKIDIEFHIFISFSFFNLMLKKANFLWCNIASSIYCWKILVYFDWYNNVM